MAESVDLPAVAKPPPTTLTKGKLTAAELAAKAEELKARFLKQRAERQKALQDGLPNLDAEVQKTRTRLVQQRTSLADIRARIAKLDQELIEAGNQEQSALEEIQRLEQSLQVGETGQKQYNDELEQLSAAEAAEAESGSSAKPGTDSGHSQSPNADVLAEDVEKIFSDAEHADQMENNAQGSLQAGTLEDISMDRTISVQHDEGTTPSAENDNLDEKATSKPDELRDATSSLGEGMVGNDPIKHGHGGYDSMEATQPVSREDVLDQSPTDGDIASRGDREDDAVSDGSASMSDSGSDDDYEPAEDHLLQPTDVDEGESDEYDPEEVAIAAVLAPVPNSDEAEYEPASAASPPPSQSSEMSAAMVDSSAASEGEQDTVGEAVVLPVGGVKAPAAEPMTESEPTKLPQPQEPPQKQIDDASNRPRPAEKTSLEGIRPLSNDGSGGSTSFTPYQSPLSAFQSFRYHSQFNDAAKDGYRSLTYSNSIDPSVPLCQTELAGNECHDPGCEDQHFRHLGLSGMSR